MLNKKRVVRCAALLAGVVAVALVGCNILQYQFCINNLSPFNLIEVNIVPQGSNSWGPDLLQGTLTPGSEQDIKGFLPGTWMVRAVFDVTDATGFCIPIFNDIYIVTNTDLTITTTNICIDYSDETGKSGCTDIYGAPRFVI